MAQSPKVEFKTIASPDGRLELEACPEIGGGITRFGLRRDGEFVDLMRPYDRRRELSPLNFSCFPMLPFSNRIGYGKLEFDGETYDIDTPFRSGEHPNHGDAFMQPWKVGKQTPHRLALNLPMGGVSPYLYQARQVFDLSCNQLDLSIAVTNLSGRALPFGTGQHPYFPRNDRTILKLRAPKVWTSKNMLPFSRIDTPEKWDFSNGKAVSGESLGPAASGDDGTAWIDHCFQRWDRKAEIIWPEKGMKLEIGADPLFDKLVIYAPSKDNFFCVEPVTNVTDGFNLMARGFTGTGTVVLRNNYMLSGSVTFRPSTLNQ